MSTAELPITNLRYDAIDETPQSFNVNKRWDENGEDLWSFHGAMSFCGSEECEECDGTGENEDEDTCGECDGEGEIENEETEDSWWPVRNAVWPIPNLCLGDWKEQLCNMTALEIDGETFLCQTGGGMNFSWAIAETYIRCGYYPPACLRLPSMASRGNSPKDKSIIAAMRISYQTQKDWMDGRLQDLDRLEGFAAEYEARKGAA